jgi:hypothetical protein
MSEIQRQNLKKQRQLSRNYQKSMGKTGSEEVSPTKFFAIFAAIVVCSFIFFKPQIGSISGWIKSVAPNLPEFLSKEFIGLNLIDWVVILIIAGAGAGLLSSMTLPAIGVLAGFCIVFILIIWPIIKPTATNLLGDLGNLIPFLDFGGGGSSSGTFLTYSIEETDVQPVETERKKQRGNPCFHHHRLGGIFRR